MSKQTSLCVTCERELPLNERNFRRNNRYDEQGNRLELQDRPPKRGSNVSSQCRPCEGEFTRRRTRYKKLMAALKEYASRLRHDSYFMVVSFDRSGLPSRTVKEVVKLLESICPSRLGRGFAGIHSGSAIHYPFRVETHREMSIR